MKRTRKSKKKEGREKSSHSELSQLFHDPENKENEILETTKLRRADDNHRYEKDYPRL